MRGRLSSTAPGPELRRLGPLVGEWRVELETLEEGGAGARPVASGSAGITSELGGRYLRWSTELELGEVPVHAEGWLGYDARRGVYQLLWLSELGHGMHLAIGRGDPERGGITLEAAERDPETGALLRARTVLTLEGVDRFTLEQEGWDPVGDGWVTRQRTRYTRCASAAPGS